MGHTKEPWNRGMEHESMLDIWPGVFKVTPKIPFDSDQFKINADRAIACVNACAGIADPAAELARLRVIEKEHGEMRELVAEAVQTESVSGSWINRGRDILTTPAKGEGK